MYQHLLYEVAEGVARISLNRPQVFHALSPDLILEVTNAVQAAAAEPGVRVVLLTATGDKAFCSGADLKVGIGDAAGFGEALRTRYNPMITAIRTIPKPVVCRLNGLAAGAGCSLALACDLVIASEEAYLSLLFVGIGLMPDAGTTYMLPRLVGVARAFELASTGRRVYATEAAQIGLIARAVPAAQLDEAVQEVLAYYRSAPTQAIGAMKQAFNSSLQSDLSAMLDLEAQLQNQLSQTQDAREGIQSFLQKRNPDYQGR